MREPADLCLVSVKHTALDAALERIPPQAVGDGLVVSLLNGIEHPAAVRTCYGARQVAPAGGLGRQRALRAARFPRRDASVTLL
ncbi:ketopantoate reductase family protein [Streptomyces sp. RGM 3693]|uniref:ketopantoate reductase family protein n=1 Tax=Streptomyces sp. RGM 3693 TaxID=3413284 RepID=UPI003D275E7E